MTGGEGGEPRIDDLVELINQTQVWVDGQWMLPGWFCTAGGFCWQGG